MVESLKAVEAVVSVEETVGAAETVGAVVLPGYQYTGLQTSMVDDGRIIHADGDLLRLSRWCWILSILPRASILSIQRLSFCNLGISIPACRS